MQRLPLPPRRAAQLSIQPPAWLAYVTKPNDRAWMLDHLHINAANNLFYHRLVSLSNSHYGFPHLHLDQKTIDTIAGIAKAPGDDHCKSCREDLSSRLDGAVARGKSSQPIKHTLASDKVVSPISSMTEKNNSHWKGATSLSNHLITFKRLQEAANKALTEDLQQQRQQQAAAVPTPSSSPKPAEPPKSKNRPRSSSLSNHPHKTSPSGSAAKPLLHSAPSSPKQSETIRKHPKPLTLTKSSETPSANSTQINSPPLTLPAKNTSKLLSYLWLFFKWVVFPTGMAAALVFSGGLAIFSVAIGSAVAAFFVTAAGVSLVGNGTLEAGKTAVSYYQHSKAASLKRVDTQTALKSISTTASQQTVSSALPTNAAPSSAAQIPQQNNTGNDPSANDPRSSSSAASNNPLKKNEQVTPSLQQQQSQQPPEPQHQQQSQRPQQQQSNGQTTSSLKRPQNQRGLPFLQLPPRHNNKGQSFNFHQQQSKNRTSTTSTSSSNTPTSRLFAPQKNTKSATRSSSATTSPAIQPRASWVTSPSLSPKSQLSE